MYGGAVTVFGGCDPNTYSLAGIDSCEVYTEDAKTGEGKWSRIADMPTARWGAAIVVVDDTILVMGGKGTKRFDIIEEYTPATNKWRTLPLKLPHPVYEIGAVYHSSTKTLMIAGGNGMFTYERYPVYTIVQPFAANTWVKHDYASYPGLHNYC